MIDIQHETWHMRSDYGNVKLNIGLKQESEQTQCDQYSIQTESNK